MSSWWLILPAVVICDLLLGDPERPVHPIRLMGNAITFFEPIFRKSIKGEQLAGALFVLLLVPGTWLLTFIIVAYAETKSSSFAILVQIVIIFYALSIRTLIMAGMTVYQDLVRGDIEKARLAVSMVVGRDTKPLDQTGLIRAIIETIAENFVDGIVSPLFYAAIGGAPLAMAYKMINTLDSMIGYKNDQYRKFGCFAAKLDDLANWIPARLSTLFIVIGAAITGFSANQAWQTTKNEATHHSSPNAGFPEAGFAGALGVCLNGPNVYHGKVVNKPFIGKQYSVPTINHILQACCLVLFSSLVAIGFVWGVGFMIAAMV